MRCSQILFFFARREISLVRNTKINISNSLELYFQYILYFDDNEKNIKHHDKIENQYWKICTYISREK